MAKERLDTPYSDPELKDLKCYYHPARLNTVSTTSRLASFLHNTWLSTKFAISIGDIQNLYKAIEK